MDLPTTRLPRVKPELYDGLKASDLDLSDMIPMLAVANPEVLCYLQQVGTKAGDGAVKCCLLLYKMLDTQAECDELSGDNQ